MDDTRNPYASPDPDAASPSTGPLFEVEIDLSRAVISEGVLTYDDVLQATKLASRSRRWARLGVVILGVLFVSASYILWIKLGIIGLLVYLIGLGYLGYSIIRAPSQSATRLWKGSKTMQEPFREVITEDVIQTIGTDFSTTVTWSKFSKYRQSDDMVLLYLVESPKLHSIFPRRTFQDDAGWDQFCGWVKDKLPPE